jgi:hypothetical protein
MSSLCIVKCPDYKRVRQLIIAHFRPIIFTSLKDSDLYLPYWPILTVWSYTFEKGSQRYEIVRLRTAEALQLLLNLNT